MEVETEIKSPSKQSSLNTIGFVQQYPPNLEILEIQQSAPAPPQRLYLWTQILTVLAACLGSLSIGFSSTYFFATFRSMLDSTTFSSDGDLAPFGYIKLCAWIVGTAAGGPLIDYFGRRPTMIAMAPPLFAGWLITGLATSANWAYVGYFLSQLYIGAMHLNIPIYLVEIVQPKVRGVFLYTSLVFIVCGEILVSGVAEKLDWSMTALVGTALPIPFFLLMLVTTDTPRWYIAKGRTQDAISALQWLRGKDNNIEDEMHDLLRSQSETNNERNAFLQLFNRKYIQPLLIILGLMLFQFLCGPMLTILSTYRNFNINLNPDGIDFPPIVTLEIVSLISTLIGLVLIDLVGRKILLYFSSIGIIIPLSILGLLSHYISEVDSDVFGYVPTIYLVIKTVSYSIGFRHIPWVMLGEILPSKIRGAAASVVIIFYYISHLFMSYTIDRVYDYIDISLLYWLHVIVCVTALIFVAFFVPETRGQSLEDIEIKMTGGFPPVKRNYNISGGNVC